MKEQSRGFERSKAGQRDTELETSVAPEARWNRRILSALAPHGRAMHAKDATNASRTLLYDINQNLYSESLLHFFRVPPSMMPKVLDCSDQFGMTAREHFFASIPINGIAGDQQAAAISQVCFSPDMVKSTYGTGCFALLNIGTRPVFSQHRLLTILGVSSEGPSDLRAGGLYICGRRAVQWLRDGLRIIETAEESGILPAAADPGQDTYFCSRLRRAREAILLT